jgi:tetratricopeptide (TPR) repeat protein
MRFINFTLVLLCFLLLKITSCYKDPEIYSTADTLRKEGKCSEAITYYTQVIDSASKDMDVAGGYFYRGECQQALGNYRSAYEDYYAARAIVCYTLRTDYAPDEGNFIAVPPHYSCNTAVPNRMKEVAKHLSKNERAEAPKKMRELLPDGYFQ